MTEQEILLKFSTVLSTFKLPEVSELIDLCNRDESFRAYTQIVKTENNVSKFIKWEDKDRNSTLHFQKLENHFPQLSLICSKLSEQLQKEVQVHALYTPADSQGFSIHYDFEDVLVVQKSGMKYWKIWRPMRTEISPELLKLDQSRQNLKKWAEISKAQEFTLKEGDMKYIPIGRPHVAWTEGLDSFHYSFKFSPEP